MTYLVKICGNMYFEDSMMVAECQPDFMGWIFSPKSPRQVTAEDVVPSIIKIRLKYPEILHAAVFAENSAEEILNIMKTGHFDMMQLVAEGEFPGKMNTIMEESNLYTSEIHDFAGKIRSRRPIFCPALRIREKTQDKDILSTGNFPLYILDSYVAGKPGGTGKSLNTEYIQNITLPYLLAGGLKPENVKSSLLSCSAIGADVSSGIEDSPGRKNREKLETFITTVRSI